MQIANILLSLAGDSGNQVPKYGVTVAEIAVLQAVHGEDAVSDIEPKGEVQRSHREERNRLLSIYGRMQDGKDASKVSVLFPGAAARVFETFAELDIDESFFKAKSRVSANEPKAAPVEPEEPKAEAAPMTAAQKRAAAAAAKKAAKDAAAVSATQAAHETAAKAAETAEPAEAESDEDNGIGDMAEQPDAFE